MKTKHILRLENSLQCLGEINSYANEVLGESVKTYVKNNCTFCDSDNINWLPRKSIFTKFTEAARNYYGFIAAFHCCKPTSLQPYMDKGLITHSKESFVDFFSEKFPYISSSIIETAVDAVEISRPKEASKIWFTISSCEVVEDSGDFLARGGEYPRMVVGKISEITGLDSLLDTFEAEGYPTVFEANLPLDYLGFQFESIARNLLSTWGNSLLNLDENDCSSQKGAVYITRNLDPKYLVRHYHPGCFRDPYLRSNTINSKTSCPWCIHYYKTDIK